MVIAAAVLVQLVEVLTDSMQLVRGTSCVYFTNDNPHHVLLVKLCRIEPAPETFKDGTDFLNDIPRLAFVRRKKADI
jgi:hypothetical protein